MEDHTVVKKRSVAELAGKFSCQIPHMTDAEVNKPVRRRPPRTLHLPASNNADQTRDEKEAGPVSPRKNRNSALIEKLQANLARSPTGPSPFPKSPGVVKLPVPSFSPTSPGSPASPPVIVTPKQEETVTSFEDPAEGGVLKSVNKGRARHSIKRRPPSRKHRKSSAEEGGEEVAATPNGHEGDVFEEQKASDCVDTTSVSSKLQETESTHAENQHPLDAEPENKVETVTRENKDEGELEQKTREVEEKKGDDPQLAGSSSESKTQEEACEEPVTQARETEPESTTHEKETEQKEEVEINN